jgi:O-antigen/teichoic acid export membrane protein
MSDPANNDGKAKPLGARVRRSLALSVLDSYVSVVLQLVSTVVLARLIAPEEFGVFAIAAAFSAMASTIRTLGTNEFVIRQPILGEAELRAACAMAWIAGIGLGLLMNLVAPFVASFYGKPALGQLISILSVSLFITPVGAVALAYFRRQLQMGTVVVVGMVETLVSFVVALVLAWRGFGALSLAASVVAGSASMAILAFLVRPKVVPALPSLKGVAQVFHFGKHISTGHLITQVGAGAPEMIIGKVAGPEQVAFFSRAQGLVELFNRFVLQAVWPIVLPTLSNKATDGAGLNAAVTRGTAYLTGVAWPALAAIAILAWPAIRVIYGTQWLEAAIYAPVLCLAGAISVALYLAKDTMIALGKARECSVLVLKVQMWRVAGIALGVPFGMSGACWGIVAAALIGTVLTWRALGQATALKLAEIAAVWRLSLWVTVFAAAPGVLIIAIEPPREDNYLAVAAAAALAMLVSWSCALAVLRHPLLAEVTSMFRAARARYRIGALRDSGDRPL